MTSLHTVNKPHSLINTSTYQNLLLANDALLFIEDGVYSASDAALVTTLLTSLAGNSSAKAEIYALKEDVNARGLAGKIDSRVTLLDYAGFVALTCKKDKVLSWF